MTAQRSPAWSSIHRVVFPVDAPTGADELYVITARAQVTGRRSIQLQEGGTASFATYFASFPAAYWVAHTAVRRVRISMRVEGSATLQILGTNRDGDVRVLSVNAEASGDVSCEVDLDDTAGRLWFDAESQDGAILSNIEWGAAEPPTSRSTVTVCVTTFDRENDCVELLHAIAGDETLEPRIELVVVADQGSRRLSAAPGFREVAADFGDRLRVFEQPNLGGSGGFSRGMLAASVQDSTYALLVDDDIRLETESITRLLDFADHAGGKFVVGAQMLSLTVPSVLHTYGERVDKHGFWWVPVQKELASVDLRSVRIENSPELSRDYEVDFNGWWMCLIPVETIRRVGASMPYFIKWDDAEFGLRAKQIGSRTVTLPGAALWHMPWSAKDDGLDWQAYFQLRNRLVTALLHGESFHGGRLITETLGQDVNHILCLQYGAVALRRQALRDVLTGPDHLDRTLSHRARESREFLRRQGYALIATSALPAHARTASRRRPSGGFQAAVRLTSVVLHQFRQVKSAPGDLPLLDRPDGKWWNLGAMDTAVLGSATSAGGFVLVRSRETALSLLRDAVLLRVRLWWQWPRLARRYRQDSARLTSLRTWAERLDPRA